MISFLKKRRSVLVKLIQEPAPHQDEIKELLQIATRVPDHGKLSPWRFIILQGEVRRTLGKYLAEVILEENPNISESMLKIEQTRFLRAPLIIVVISSPKNPHKVPEWEQVLSAGAAAQNLLIATQAMGYAAQWVTEWYSYHTKVRSYLKLTDSEKIVGFIYIGTTEIKPQERDRPKIEDVVQWGL